MADFISAALTFPTVLFTFLLLVVVGYWLVVILGGADADSADTDATTGALSGLGLGGVPVTVVLSILIALAWFVSLAGAVVLKTGNVPAAGAIALATALIAAWGGTRLAVVALRRALPTGNEPSRNDFLGRTCVIRTGRVTADFGQAEVRAADGSTAVIQVRQAGADPLTAGSEALLYDFDADREFFWVVPADVALHPDPSTAPTPRTGARQDPSTPQVKER